MTEYCDRLTLKELTMHFTAVIEQCKTTGFYVGYVPGFPGAHSQGQTQEELDNNLREVITMLLEDGKPQTNAEFVGTRQIAAG